MTRITSEELTGRGWQYDDRNGYWHHQRALAGQTYRVHLHAGKPWLACVYDVNYATMGALRVVTFEQIDEFINYTHKWQTVTLHSNG